MEEVEQLKNLTKEQLIQKVVLLMAKFKDLERGSKDICEQLSERFKEQIQKNEELEELLKKHLGLNEVYPTECDESLLTKLG
jgi:thioredoxin-related protein